VAHKAVGLVAEKLDDTVDAAGWLRGNGHGWISFAWVAVRRNKNYDTEEGRRSLRVEAAGTEAGRFEG
jgi:hypothetical protein